MGRPAKATARDTRAEILTAAIDLFAEQGFHGTSMRDLARRVGVRESALYHHFENKQALFTAVVAHLGPEGAEEITRDLDIEALLRSGPQAFLRTIAHRVLEWWATPEQQKFVRVIIGDLVRGGTGVRPDQMIGRVLELFSGVFGELVRRGLIRPGDPELYAAEWMGPLMMIRLRFMMTAGETPDLKKAKALADRHVAFFLQAVRT